MASLHREAFFVSLEPFIRRMERPRQVVSGPNKSALKYWLPAGLLVVAGAVFLVSGSHGHPPITPSQLSRSKVSPSTSPAASGNLSPSPAVAGAATSAPRPGPPPAPAASTRQTGTTGGTSSANSPQSTVNLQINSGASAGFTVSYVAGMNACSILTEAKNEGKVPSVTLVYYSSFQSDYVKELNGQSDNWTFKYNGTSPPVGCSKVPLHPGDTVTWSYKQ